MTCSTVVLLIIAVAAITATSALNFLNPPNKELIYDWQALVKAGTHLPSNYASQFSLNGKIHLQTNGPNTFVKIANLTYKLYNGKLDHIQEYQAQDLPVQISELESVFKVLHDENGLVVKVGLNKNDQQFSWNIKRAIASILQIDKSVMEPITYPKSFVQKELSIYRKLDIDYTVTHDEDETIRVNKFHNMRTPEHLYKNSFFVVEPEQCSLDYQPLTHISSQNYVITKKNTHYILEEIETYGYLKYQPFQTNSEHQLVYVNQTMELVEMVQIKKPMEVIDEAVQDTLKYNPFVASKDGSLNDVTNGAYKFDYEKAWPKLKKMLTRMVQYMDENHLNINEPGSTKGDIVNEVQRLLQLFSLKNLEDIHTKLEGPSMEMFHHILPLVGTKASLMFIKKLLTDKTLPDDMLIESLKYFPEQVVSPTLDVLENLEDLMHLTEDYTWEVREAALLSFATLIHKHVIYMEKMHLKTNDVDPYRFQKPVEKYVLVYVNKLKEASNYKTQMVYADGLGNIRLPSVSKHLQPAVNGEWKKSERFRFLVLRPMALGVLSDVNKDNLYKILWPIVSNKNETAIIRMDAFYYFINFSRSISRLLNMYKMLATEQDQEFYSYAYSSLDEISKRFKPCHEKYQMYVTNLLKMLPPPTLGRSGIQNNNVKDQSDGFGDGMVHHLVITKDTFLVATELQNSNGQFQQYSLLIKIDGMKFRGRLMDVISDILKQQPSAKIGWKDVHIEVHLFRHDYAINTFYFNVHNLKDLNKLLGLFSQNQHSVIKDLTQVIYNKYQVILMPNDLGLPVVWNYLQPTVQRLRFSLKKEIVNKLMSLQLNVNFSRWIHWQHGLAFYNPVAHLWQGIRRYHSFDGIIPINLEITVNTEQHSLQICWKKLDHLEANAIGFKSHVQQMVFVVDDNESGVLRQSSPSSRDMVVVRDPKEITHTTVLYDKEILNTGHQWYSAIYDSTSYVDKNALQKFLMSTPLHTRKTATLLRRLITTWMYFHQYYMHLPKIGTHGFILKILPMNNVTDINLFVRLHSDPVTKDTFFYSPRLKLSNRLTFSVKNQDTILKSWDINTILDQNAGHTINNLKMFITKIVEGENDYKVCVDGIKKWGDQEVSGHLNIAMSQSPDGKCNKEDTVLDISMIGKKSKEQVDGHKEYSSCQKINPDSLQCLVDHSTIRHYLYNIKTSTMPVGFKKTFAYLWDTFKGNYASHYQYQDEHNEEVSQGMIKVEVEYPVGEDMIDVNVTMPEILYQLNGLPTKHYQIFEIYPDSTAYPRWFQFLHQVGWVDHCVVDKDHHRINEETDYKIVPLEWTLYVGNKLRRPDKAVYIKRMPNQELAVKIVDGAHTIVIEPLGNSNKITVDGTALAMDKYHHEEWVYFQMFRQDLNQLVAVAMEHSGLYVKYHRNHIDIVVPKLEKQILGRCYQTINNYDSAVLNFE